MCGLRKSLRRRAGQRPANRPRTNDHWGTRVPRGGYPLEDGLAMIMLRYADELKKAEPFFDEVPTAKPFDKCSNYSVNGGRASPRPPPFSVFQALSPIITCTC